MLSLVAKLQTRVGSIGRDQSGQDAFEYLLVIGIVMVAVVGAVATGFTPGSLVTTIVGKVTTAITNLFPA